MLRKSRYWESRSEIADKLVELTAVQRKISMARLAEKEGIQAAASAVIFDETDEAKRLAERANAQNTDRTLCRKQSQLLQKKGFAASLRSAWVKLYTSSKLGLDINRLSAGARDSSVKGNFRTELMKVTEQVDLDERKDLIWCPITSCWFKPKYIKAAHIFPWKSGQDAMTAIFGEDAIGELFSAKNGMLLSLEAEEKFDSGALALVPRVSNLANAAEIKAWNETSIKEYKIRVMRTGREMDVLCDSQSPYTWTHLDNQPVTFKGSFRPRTRYLYYAYCVAVLRRAYTHESRPDALKDSLGQKYWGTVGPYLKKSMIRGFIETLGHDYDELMDGAIAEDDDEETDLTMIATANAGILRSHGPEDGSSAPVYSTEIREESDDDEDD